MLHKFVLFALLCPFASVAQIDSLQSALQFANSDSSRVNIHIELYQEWLKSDTTQALKALNQAENISKSINSTYLLGTVYNKRGIFLEETFQLDSAIKIYLQGISLLKQSPHKRLLLETQRNLIFMYYRKDLQPKAIEIGYEVLKGYQELGDSLMIARSLNSLGIAYDYLSEHKTAIELYNQSIEYNILIGNKDGEARSRHNLAGIYHDDGDTERAISEYEKVIEVVELLDEPEFLAMAYNNYGLVYLETEHNKAEKLFLKAQKIAIANDDLTHIGFTNQNLTNLYLEKKDYSKAEKFGLKTLSIATKMGNAQLTLNSNSYLSDIYYALKKYKKAMDHMQASRAIQDSTYTKENAQIIQELQAKYDADKKDAENELLKKDAEISAANIKKQNALIIFILISLGGVLLTGLIYFRLSYIRKKLVKEVSQKNKEVESQAEKLKELDAAKSRFFANVSHDLRTPLTLIMGSLERIKESKDSYLTHQSSKDLDQGIKNSKRLLFLANEINELNQLEEGRLKLNLESIQVGKFVGLIVSMFSSAAESKSVKLKIDSQISEDIRISADPNHFERIIYNLLNNALKFTPSGGTISVMIDEKDEQSLQIIISDTGKGIPEKSLPYIFDRFYQSLLNEYSAREGFGIGLALVKELVNLHNCKIDVSSKEGEGTSFRLICPIEISEKDAKEITPVLDYDKDWLVPNLETKTTLKIDIPESKPVSDKLVLIVEDHPDVREYINDIIGQEYTTRLASDGTQALEILEKEKIQLVVTDLMMPWMDGFELIEKMKDEERYQDIPIMVVSARTNDEDRAKILSMGVNDYLIKPFNSKELLARIDNMISTKVRETGNLFVNDEGVLQGIEKDLLKKVESLIIKNISNSKLSVLDLADEMAASERQVYRMIKKLAGITPFEYIKEVRWQYVEYLLKNNKVNSVSEAAKNIGMSNVTDFKRQFKKRFDKEPAEYIP